MTREQDTTKTDRLFDKLDQSLTERIDECRRLGLRAFFTAAAIALFALGSIGVSLYEDAAKREGTGQGHTQPSTPERGMPSNGATPSLPSSKP